MLKFLEGFDSYGAGTFQSSYKWDNANVVTLSTGRFSGLAAFLDTTILTKSIPSSTGMTVGFAMILPEDGGDFLELFDSVAATVITVGTQATSSLFYVTSTTTEYSTMPAARNTWIYFEISVVDFSSSAAGNVTIRMNGDLIFSSSIGFILTGSGLAGGLSIFGPGANSIGYDDLYICDETGAYNTTYIEDGEILTLFPDSPGDVTDFSLFGAATNWQAVSEQPFDGDTSYVFSNVAGTQDLYTVDNMSIGDTFVIPGIMVNTVDRKDGPDVIGHKALLKSGSNLGTGTGVNVTTSYLNYQQVFEREPVTNNPWNETLVNAMQIGAEVYI